MATKKSGRENVAGSVTGSPGVTAGRTRQERRIGGGNMRKGQAGSMKQVGAISSSKTGDDARRRSTKGSNSRTRSTKRPSSR